MPANKTVGKKQIRTPRRAAGKLNRVDHAVIAGLKAALAHARGEITLPTRYVEVPDPVDVKAIRRKLGLSQSEFSKQFGFSVRTLQDWESGRSTPPSAARAYLIVIDRRPNEVWKALLGAA
jgi:putative transcriptional regulator